MREGSGGSEDKRVIGSMKGMKAFGRYGSLGFELLGSIAVGYYLGVWLDKKAGTSWIAFVGFLLGQQSYGGKTDSEGGFESDAVATANVLESSAPVVDGKQYYSIKLVLKIIN